jgi:azobenzene reductase
MTPIRILSIIGSPRRNSRVKAGIKAVHNVLVSHGVESYVWNLGEHPLPFMDPETRGNAGPDDSVLACFLQLAREADGFVLGSPLYHNSYSGWLKNALDHLSGRDHLGGKAFGLTSNGGHRSLQAVDHLRIVVRSVQGIAIPTQLCTDEEDFTLDQDGELHLTAPPILERVARFSEELIEFTVLMKNRREGIARRLTE